MGPPYRWMIPDCRCFYSDNLYVKIADGEAIDAYFRLPSLDTTLAQFWAANTHGPERSEAIRTDIFRQALREAKRRLSLSSQFRHNSTMCHEHYEPLCKELFPP